MRPSRLSGWTLNSMAGVLIKRDTHTKGRSLVRTRLRLEGCSQKPRMLEPPEVGQGGKDGPPNLQRKHGLPTPPFWSSGLQNWERKNFSLFLPPVWVDSMLWPQDTQAQKKAGPSICSTWVGEGPGTHGVQGYLWGIQDSQRTGASWNVGTCLVVMMTGISWVRLRCSLSCRMRDGHVSPDGSLS